MYLTKGEFLQKFGILPQEFEEADISWEELLEIADDYERRRPTLEKIRKEFVAEFLQDKEKEIGLQSYHSRLKDTEHLVEKLVRKRQVNYAKYLKMDATNNKRYETDKNGISEDAVSVVVSNAVVYMPLEDLIDKDKEIERLTKETERLTKEIARCEGMLNNPNFVNKAPAAKVDAEKDKLAKYKEMMDKVKGQLEQLKK